MIPNTVISDEVNSHASLGKLRLRVGVSAESGKKPLATLNWQPKRADDVWTRAEYTALCEHLHNENGETRFVMGFCNSEGHKDYVRSKRLKVDRAISWAWSSIAGSPKSRLAFVPYSQNGRHQSRWGGMDFDAHEEGQEDRARELAFSAFRILLNAPNLCIVLETSGSAGWHVWAISTDFHDIQDWIRLLKGVASAIGATIVDGACEIFPPDSLPSQFGKGMRAPGCWNPATNSCSKIVWENSRTSLESVLSRKSKSASLIRRQLEGDFPDKRKKLLSSDSSYRESEVLQSWGINLTCTRNHQLSGLVGEIFHQVGKRVGRLLAEAQFQKKTVSTKATETEHLASFEKLWNGLNGQWLASLSTTEQNIFAQLETENERDAFRIVRSYARKAESDGTDDFPIARNNLGQRLGLTGNGAAGIRDKLVGLGAIAQTANYVPNKFAARFKWLAGEFQEKAK